MSETRKNYKEGQLSKGNDSGNPYNNKPTGKSKVSRNKSGTGPSVAKEVAFDLRKDKNPK
jgi:hypothetical protein